MSDQQKPTTQKLHGETLRLLTAAILGAVLLSLSGLILTFTIIALIIATPILVVFSPILVPAGIVLFLVIGGFLFSGCCGMVAVAALAWIYNYVAGKTPPGSDRLDYAKMKIADKTRDLKEKAKDYGQQKINKTQGADQAS